jgi:hypothetical protein
MCGSIVCSLLKRMLYVKLDLQFVAGLWYTGSDRTFLGQYMMDSEYNVFQICRFYLFYRN